MRRGRRCGAAAALAVIALLVAGSAPALAVGTLSGSVAPTFMTLFFTAGAADQNDLRISGSGAGVTITDVVPINTTVVGCTGSGSTTITCSGPEVARITANVGNGNDKVTNDSSVISELLGGAGMDEVLGGSAADRLNGGEGNIQGDGGVDTVDGRAGDDSFMMFPGDGNDVLIGGPDIDLIDVLTNFFAADPLLGHFSLGDGVANDGWDAQAGNLREIEDIEVTNNFNPATGTETGTNQLIRGTSGENVVLTGLGNDDVDGLAGSDKVDMAGGNDTAEARDGFQDRIACGPGDDTAHLDQLDDESGCETVTRTFVQPFATSPPRPAGYPLPTPPKAPTLADCPPGKNLITLTSGNDNRNGTVGADLIFAGAGNDSVNALTGDDCIDLGTGNDRGNGGSGRDLVLGGLGNDVVSGFQGDDRLTGDAGDDRVLGENGNDRLFGGAGADRVFGQSGNDRLNGQSGSDQVSGAGGRDRINGGAGADTASGGSGVDVVNGDAGNDRISGGGSRDVLRGNSGRDRISARDNRRDRISCGTGRDTVSADRIDRVARDCERVRRG